jgi:hypothetical protein
MHQLVKGAINRDRCVSLAVFNLCPTAAKIALAPTDAYRTLHWSCDVPSKLQPSLTTLKAGKGAD